MNLKEGNRLNWFIFIQSETFNFAPPPHLGEANVVFPSFPPDRHILRIYNI
jgi:hypothetical protein